jgi:ribosomal RNA assembly protein
MEAIKIPEKRIMALRGTADATINLLEKKLNVQIDVDEDGAVTLEGEPVDKFFATPVIRAIGRGFDANVAVKLLSDENGLHIIDIRDYAKTKESLARLKGRVIGEKGKSRKVIEEQSECDLAIYGHTVGIIGHLEDIEIAANAVFKLLEGQPHSSVYLYLEKIKRRKKQQEMEDKKTLWK